MRDVVPEDDVDLPRHALVDRPAPAGERIDEARSLGPRADSVERHFRAHLFHAMGRF